MSEERSRLFASPWAIVIAGAAIGGLAALLQLLGNPPDMAICVACFLRDTTGALGLHRMETVQYIRPEIIGMLLGALAMIGALAFAEQVTPTCMEN